MRRDKSFTRIWNRAQQLHKDTPKAPRSPRPYGAQGGGTVTDLKTKISRILSLFFEIGAADFPSSRLGSGFY